MAININGNVKWLVTFIVSSFAVIGAVVYDRTQVGIQIDECRLKQEELSRRIDELQKSQDRQDEFIRMIRDTQVRAIRQIDDHERRINVLDEKEPYHSRK